MNTRRWILVGLVATLIALVAALSTSRSGPDVVETVSKESIDASGPAVAESVQSENAPPGTSRRELEAPPLKARDPERGPVLLAGRVVDDIARPVEHYTIWAAIPGHHAHQPDIEEMIDVGSTHVLDGESVHIVERKRRRIENESLVKAIRLENGHFEVRGWTQEERIRVRASSQGRRITREYKVGTSDVVIVFSRIGIVRARLLHDRGVSAREFELSLRKRVDWPPIPLKAARYDRPGERSFEKEQVAVGRYALEVRLRDHPDLLMQLDGISVEPGEVCRDPRLERIDVRGFCRSMTVTLLRPNGRPLPLPAYLGAEVTALDPNGEPLPVQPKLRKSRVELTTRHGYVDLCVRLKRYREVHLPLLRDDCAVHVELSDAGEVEAEGR